MKFQIAKSILTIVFNFDYRLEFFKTGAHNLHLRYADEFNSLVFKFLTEKSSSL